MALPAALNDRQHQAHREPAAGGVAIAIVNPDGSTIGGSGGTSMVDDSPFTPAGSSLTPAGGIVTADSVDSGDVGAFAMLTNRQQKITLYDSAGVEITSFGGGTQYTEDVATPADPIGNAHAARRRDTLAPEVSTDGDWVILNATNKAELYVKHADPIPVTDNGGVLSVDDAAGSLTVDAPVATPVAVRQSDGAAFYNAAKDTQLPAALVGGRLDVNLGAAPATVTVTATDLDVRNLVPAQDEIQARGKAQFDDTAPTLPAEDAYADLRITGQRDLRVNLRNNAGTEIATATTPLRTDPTGTTTQPVSGTVTANQGTAGAAGWPVRSLAGDELATVRTTLDPVDGAGTAVTIKFARVNATADGDNTIIAAVGGKKIRVLGYALTVTAAGTITLQDTQATPVIAAQFSLAAQGGVAYAGGLDAPAFETASGFGLEINNPAGVDTLGHITYLEL